MNGLSVVISSRNFRNLRACVEALHMRGSGRLIIVDDGIAETGYVEAASDYDRGACLDGATIIRGEKPFVFARNANLGIQAVEDDDIVLLNDDALLMTPGGFGTLQQAAAEHPEYGLIGAVCNNVGNPRQLPHGTSGLREEPHIICFVCVLIPRRTFDRVGLLDERFVAYGWEDNDYCRRVQLAGLKLGIHDGVYVDHGSLVSTFRSSPGAAGDIEPGRKIFIDKWGREL